MHYNVPFYNDDQKNLDEQIKKTFRMLIGAKKQAKNLRYTLLAPMTEFDIDIVKAELDEFGLERAQKIIPSETLLIIKTSSIWELDQVNQGNCLIGMQRPNMDPTASYKNFGRVLTLQKLINLIILW